MQVLKFGGTSVANSENIMKVVKIILSHGNDKPTVVVISAFSGITNMLHLCGTMAAAGNEEYRELLLKIEHRHLDAVRELIPIIHQSALLSSVKKCCNELEEICNGIFLLNELSPRTLDRILSYGELLSSQIVFSTIQASTDSVKWIDARELIITDNNFNNARVEFDITDKGIRSFLETRGEKLFIVPGFIGSYHGITTTLGRGGSDYTAAIFAGAIKADHLEIWTDVDGMMTADPRIVSNA